MTFTVFTWIIAVFWVSLFAKMASWMRRRMAFLNYFSLSPFLLLLLLCVLRVFVFAEFPFTVTLESRHVLAWAYRFLCKPFLSLGSLRISLAAVLALLWGARAAWILIMHCRSYCHFRCMLRSLPKEDGIRLSASFQKAIPCGRLQKATVIVHPLIPSPAVVGFLHPMLILPSLDFTEDELLGIFLHEGAHYRYGHCLIKCLAGIIDACFWWNPFLGELSAEIEHALEMQADKAVCKALTPRQQRNYMEGILKVVSHMDEAGLVPGMPCCLVAEGDGEKLRQRFEMIAERHYQGRKKWDAVAALLMITLFFLSYGLVLQPYGEPALADYGMHLEPFPLGCYLVQNGQGYDFYDEEKRLLGYATMNDVMIELPICTEENAGEETGADEGKSTGSDSSKNAGIDGNESAGTDRDRNDGTDADKSTESRHAETGIGKADGENASQVGTLRNGNRTAYKYRYINGEFYRRRWSYTYQRWEDRAWKQLVLDEM